MCGYSAGCRLTSRSALKKTLWVQKVQLSFAFLPNYTNHFQYSSRKLESTVSSVMSHVSPANFQALDQRVSENFPIGKIAICRLWDKGTWQTQMARCVSENFVTPAYINLKIELFLSVLCAVSVLNVISVFFFVLVRWSGLEFGRGKPTRCRLKATRYGTLKRKRCSFQSLAKSEKKYT